MPCASRAILPTCLLPCTRRSHGRHSPRFACLLALFALARIACLLHICVRTSRFHYSIWARTKKQAILVETLSIRNCDKILLKIVVKNSKQMTTFRRSRTSLWSQKNIPYTRSLRINTRNTSLCANAQSPQKKESGRKIDVYLFWGGGAVCTQANFMTVV